MQSDAARMLGVTEFIPLWVAPPPESAALVESPLAVLTVLLAVLAALFTLDRHPLGARLFKRVPLLVFCYFVPTLLSNTGVIPVESELYTFIRRVLLPASLLLLVLATDIPAVIRLGRDAVTLFLAGTASILVGGPLAFLALGWLFPVAALDQAWRGLAALCGSCPPSLRRSSRRWRSVSSWCRH